MLSWLYPNRSVPGNLNKPLSEKSATNNSNGLNYGAENGKRHETETFISIQGESSAGSDGHCQMSGLKMIHGQDATPESVGIHDFENDLKKVAELQQLGEAIRNSFS